MTKKTLQIFFLFFVISLEFDVTFKGSDSVERRGVFFSISDQDHPVTKLLQSPYKLTKGIATLVGLSYKKVSCKVSDLEFEQTYNIPYTKLNCEVFAYSKNHRSCSLGPYYGVLKSKTGFFEMQIFKLEVSLAFWSQVGVQHRFRCAGLLWLRTELKDSEFRPRPCHQISA